MLYRAFFAIPAGLHSSKGVPTNAIYGFALMFRKILAGRQPSYGAVVFDPAGPIFREEKYPDYKANRPVMPADLATQLPWIHRVVASHRFPTLEVAGYEADDVIGTLARHAVAAGHEVHIISADKDFAQLIDDDVRMVDTIREVTYDAELVAKKWGAPPSGIVDLLALMGDKADNVPGVPGIGQKTAAQLLERFGSLDAILDSADQLKGRQKQNLIQYRDQALLSRELVTIDVAVPLERSVDSLAVVEPDWDEVDALYRELEFFSLLRDDAGGAVTPDAADFAAVTSVAELESWLDGLSGAAVAGEPKAGRPVAEATRAPVALLAVSELPSPVTGELVGLALADTPTRARWIPLGGAVGSLGEAGLAVVRGWLEDPARPKIGYDVRDTYTLLGRAGIAIDGVVGDVQLASFLIDPTKNIPHRLDQIAREFLARPLAPDKSVIGSGKQQRRFAAAALDDLTAWSCQHAAAIVEMWPALRDRLAAEGQRRCLDEVALPLSRVLGRMQRDGIRVDVDDLDHMEVEFTARKAEVEAEIYRLAGHEFNIGSTKQLATVLFEELELPVIKRTKTGYSTDAEVLARLVPDHEIARQIVRQRALAKLINTYTTVLREAILPATGRVHCTLQQTTGASGRLITTDPDLQRTPIRSEDGKRIRQAFLPAPGWVMISADWSQIELRVLAHFSGDPLLCSAFRDGVDVHRRTAGQIFDVAPEEVSAAQREVGKTVNFATIYGQGATALGHNLGISRSEAKRYIDRYFARYAKVREWIDRTVAEAHQRGFVTTLLGRRRYIPELSSQNQTDRAYGERVAANTPIQGSAADLCKLAMLAIAERLAGAGMATRMLLQIHDELLFEAPPEEVDAAVRVIRDGMEHPYPLAVPLVVDIGHGASWAEAH